VLRKKPPKYFYLILKGIALLGFYSSKLVRLLSCPKFDGISFLSEV